MGCCAPITWPMTTMHGRIVLRDGSFEADVPLEALAATFGATFSIVSQTNPHSAHLPQHSLPRHPSMSPSQNAHRLDANDARHADDHAARS